MKKQLTTILFIVFVITISMSSCNESIDFAEEKTPPDNAPITGTVAGKINHNELEMTDKGSCTFDRFPWSVAKFKELQLQVATEPQGAVTMVLIAMEIFRKYPVIGEKCLYLTTTENEHDPNNLGRMSKDRIMYRLNELLRGNDNYYTRPYQVAAYLKGAHQQNGYIPQKPYTVEVEIMNFSYEYNSKMDAKYIQYYVLTGGKDSGKDIIRVIKPWDSKYFLVDNFPGLYSQVKELPGSKTWNSNMFIE
ncbi:MAG: hypothetical protein GX762_05960 [Bacteroidales bacterium]|jgi:D-methionine transport system substrate-binding protein|nr:hypothetical protein [Bacteroidales bacterium]